MSHKSLKGTWRQALITFFSPLLVFLGMRWALVEPFVIPSESMVPNLLIHDHIMVFKSSFGLRFPFTNKWIMRWSEPKHGDIVVFKYPIDPNIYYIKRIIGKPGDSLKITNGRVELNQTPAVYNKMQDSYLYSEQLLASQHQVRFIYPDDNEQEEQIINVPEGKYFVMGDNRDASSDSRVWGFVPEENLVGRAWLIWLSCDQTMVDFEFLCDPLRLRWSRFFKKVEGL